MDELVQPAELRVPERGRRPELEPVGQRVLPRPREIVELAGGVGVDAHLEERPLFSGLQLGRELELVEDVRALPHHEFRGIGRPLAGAFLDRGVADLPALLEVLVRPHVDDLVQRPDLGVPIGGELRVFLAVLVGLPEALLHLGQRLRLDVVGSHLVDHGCSPV
jgi:hypothetical protein